MKCSVLLPVYNGESFLRPAIESILLQDCQNFEFLIIDDASNDRSAELIREYAARDGRIRAVFHRQNSGLAATLNEGLLGAKCDLIVRMDQDDIALPNRIGAQVEFMGHNPEVTVAGSFVYHMGRKPANDHLIKLPTGHEEIVDTLPRENCIYHPSVIMRRRELLELGGYRTEFRNAEDYDLWLRVARVHRLANIAKPLLRYRFSIAGMTLGRKWEQALYTRMAVASYRHPGWSLEQNTEQARADLEELGKDRFLMEVARGTMEELIRLRLFGYAVQVWSTFTRLLGWRSGMALAQCFGKAFVRACFP